MGNYPLVPPGQTGLTLSAPPEVEEALAHADPEVVERLKGVLWRARALQTAREPAIALATEMGRTVRDQAAVNPLRTGQKISAEALVRVEQDAKGCGGYRHGVNICLRIHIERN